jgi:hypothetical protein
MLQAHFRGPLGEDIQLLDGQLGFSVKGSVNTLETALRRSTFPLPGQVVNSANSVGAGIIQAGKALPAAAGVAANIGCGLVRHPATPQGAAFTSHVPNPFAQGIAKSVEVGTGICNMMSTPAMRAMPTQSSGWAPVRQRETVASSTALPPGSIQWQNRSGRWTYAAPKTKTLSGALGWATIKSLGAPGFVSPWIPPGKFTSPTAIVPGRFKKTLWQRQYNWYDVNTADSPYRTTWGIGETHSIVGMGPMAVMEAMVVTEAEGKNATTPIYKKWWFWALIGGGAVAIGGSTYTIYKRR